MIKELSVTKDETKIIEMKKVCTNLADSAILTMYIQK